MWTWHADISSDADISGWHAVDPDNAAKALLTLSGISKQAEQVNAMPVMPCRGADIGDGTGAVPAFDVGADAQGGRQPFVCGRHNATERVRGLALLWGWHLD